MSTDHTRATVAVGTALLVALMFALALVGGHRRQTYLDTHCRNGDVSACAQGGRP